MKYEKPKEKKVTYTAYDTDFGNVYRRNGVDYLRVINSSGPSGHRSFICLEGCAEMETLHSSNDTDGFEYIGPAKISVGL